MMTNPHASTPVVTRGAPVADAAIVAIGLHGRDLGAASALELAERLAVPGVAFVIPEAEARSWYPQSFLAPLAANQPRLDHALARVTELVTGLALPPQRIFIVGFSQGACLALEWLSRAPHAIGGVIAFTGGLIGPPGTVWPATPIADTPVLLTTSDPDAWVPLDRVRQTAAMLAARGARVALPERGGRPHLVDDFEVATARALLADAVATSRAIGG